VLFEYSLYIWMPWEGGEGSSEDGQQNNVKKNSWQCNVVIVQIYKRKLKVGFQKPLTNRFFFQTLQYYSIRRGIIEGTFNLFLLGI